MRRNSREFPCSLLHRLDGKINLLRFSLADGGEEITGIGAVHRFEGRGLDPLAVH